MAKFPVESDDNVGVIDALNYLLSGPAGLGQNFSGVSFSTSANMNLNMRPPFTVNGTALLSHTKSIATTEYIDSITIKCTYVTPFPPSAIVFLLGQGLFAASLGDFTDPINYYGQDIGIVESAAAYCIIRLTKPILPTTTVSGGTLTISMFTSNHAVTHFKTDCNAYVTVTGATDRVFISSQLNAVYNLSITGSFRFFIDVAVARYRAFSSNNVNLTDYEYILDKYIAHRTYTYDYHTFTPPADNLYSIDTLFNSIIDTPEPGYYWYVLEVRISYAGGTPQPTVGGISLNQRALTAQVVKE